MRLMRQLRLKLWACRNTTDLRLDELKITQYRLARELGVPAMRINHVVKGKRPVTAELALRLGRFFGQNPRYWINLQSRYDIDVAEDALSEHVAREVHPLTASV